MQPNVTTIPKLARELGLSRTAVYKWVKNGKIPAFRAGHAYLIRQADVRRLLFPELTKADKLQIKEAAHAVMFQYAKVFEWLSRE
ncbi:MAG: helix-turn-helix domain-containing protein [Phycisphaerae bacterium]|nr:helix-turn-helix domain-containing protein [Phycisphaerae bacterium]